MPWGKILQGFRNSRQNLHRLFGNRARQSVNRFVKRRSDWFHRKLLKRHYQRMCKAAQPIPMGDDALALDFIQDFADFRRRPLALIQKRNKFRNCPLKIDIVFPERIVGIDQEILRSRRWHLNESNGYPISRRFWEKRGIHVASVNGKTATPRIRRAVSSE